jgi:hypothetical protein
MQFDTMLLAAAAAATPTTEFLIINEELVFKQLRESLMNVQSNLSGKCSCLRALQDVITAGIELDHLDDSSTTKAVTTGAPAAIEKLNLVSTETLTKAIWKLLATTEFKRRANGAGSGDGNLAPKISMEECSVNLGPSGVDLGKDNTTSSGSIEDILKSNRWEICGFPVDRGHPLADYAANGLLAAHCTAFFLNRYRDEASEIVQQFVRNRSEFCTFPQVCVQLTKFASDALGLLPTPLTPDHAPIQFLSRQPSWRMLGEEFALQQTFSVAMMCFNDAWMRTTDKVHQLAYKDTPQNCYLATRDILMDLLAQCLARSEDVVEAWRNMKAQLDAEDAKPKKPSMLSPSKRSTLSPGRRPSEVSQGPTASVSSHESQGSSSSPPSSSASHAKDNEKGDSGEIADYVKTLSGIDTKVLGGSSILTMGQVNQLEAVIPRAVQCSNWHLLYRMTRDGSSLSTLMRRARKIDTSLLVVKDAKGSVFGALVPEAMKEGEKDKYYGNGTVAVWSFNSGVARVYASTNKNSYYILSSSHSLGFGGGGNFALFLVSVECQ